MLIPIYTVAFNVVFLKEEKKKTNLHAICKKRNVLINHSAHTGNYGLWCAEFSSRHSQGATHRYCEEKESIQKPPVVVSNSTKQVAQQTYEHRFQFHYVSTCLYDYAIQLLPCTYIVHTPNTLFFAYLKPSWAMMHRNEAWKLATFTC